MDLLAIREKLRAFYGTWSLFIDPVLRFVLVFVTLFLMNSHLGYLTALGNVVLMLLISVICAVLPRSLRVIVIGLCMLGNLYMLSMEAAGIGALLLLLMYVTYYIFQPADGDLLYIVPILFVLRVPYLIPIVLGLTGTMLSAIPAAFGILLYYFLKWITVNASVLSSTSVLTTFQKLAQMVSGLLTNQTMFLYMIAFAVTICVVYLIRRLSVRYSWAIAVFTGSLVDLIILVAGVYYLELKLSLINLILGVLLGLVIGAIIEFFIFLVDYSRVVRTQFEDDEYYYYVKAVPKFAISSENVQVKQIVLEEEKSSRSRHEKKKAVEGKRAPEKQRPETDTGSVRRRREEKRITHQRADQEILAETQNIAAVVEASLAEEQAAKTGAGQTSVRRRRTRTSEQMPERTSDQVRREAQAQEQASGRELTDEELARRKAAYARRKTALNRNTEQ